MFNETLLDSTILDSTKIALTFVKSEDIQVYPSGRRRSSAIDKDGDTDTKDTYYIPFDPESRLHTEANNRKHSGLNGFTQTYVKDWDNSNKFLTLVLAGYLFNITLDDNYITKVADSYEFNANDFGRDIHTLLSAYLKSYVDTEKARANEYIEESEKAAIIEAAESLAKEVEDSTKLYANILLEDVNLFSGFHDYYTNILRDQGGSEKPDPSLDLLNTITKTGGSRPAMQNYRNYYFSGLSFSAMPLTGQEATRSVMPKVVDRGELKKANQTVVSLCVLEKISGAWQIHQPALLPKIAHGVTEDSIVVGDTIVKRTLKVATDTTGGTIEADSDITSYGNIEAVGTTETAGNIIAGRNVTAGNDITATNTTTTKDLVVSANAAIEDLDVTTNIDADTINVTTSIVTTAASITNANIAAATVTTTLNVQKANEIDDDAVANIDKAVIATEEVTNATITDVTITDAVIANTLTATTDLGEVANITTRKANITDTLAAETVSATNVSASNTISASTFIQDNNPVPVIDIVEQDNGYWQLQLSRVSVKAKS